MTYVIDGVWESTGKKDVFKLLRKHDEDEPKTGVITTFLSNGFLYGGLITKKTKDYLYIYIAW